MTISEKIKGRKIGVIGMARSGVAAALLARRFGGVPFVTDASPREKLATQIGRLNEAGIPFETDGHTDQLLSSDYIIISPGVPLTAEIVKRVREKNIPIFSELEFASWVCQGKIIAVTGSNGKTTTTTLLGEILKAAGLTTYVCGNIGAPFADIADQVGEDEYAVVEVSTFQLETIDQFCPDVALLLNLTPDHLDRHGSFEAYKELKFRITENQMAENLFLTNADDPETNLSKIESKATRLRFSITHSSEPDTMIRNGQLTVKHNNQLIDIIPVEKIKIFGQHNLQNAAAAALAAIKVGVKPESIAQVLANFPGVEHRLELVGKIAGIRFINDSKATNVDSTAVAIKAMTGGVHLILGGLGKGAPYTPILEAGREKILSMVLLGQAKEDIFAQLGKYFPSQFAATLEEAVAICFELARPGETVLLSPACASFDMFNNFEHRGEMFKAAVNALKTGSPTNGTLSNS